MGVLFVPDARKVFVRVRLSLIAINYALLLLVYLNAVLTEQSGKSAMTFDIDFINHVIDYVQLATVNLLVPIRGEHILGFSWLFTGFKVIKRLFRHIEIESQLLLEGLFIHGWLDAYRHGRDYHDGFPWLLDSLRSRAWNSVGK